MLHSEKDLFEKVILDTAEHFGIVPVIIEKDYYVTLFLCEIVKRQPDIIFKGGTSLSKCYRLINRFSEDIDLNIESEQKPTESQRKQMVANIREMIDSFGFVLRNPDSIRSRRDFNRFDVDVHSLFESECIKHDLIVETAVFIRSYPSVKKEVNSYVGDYLHSIGREDMVKTYGLQPFEIRVQAVERTFIDKLFAICDYYLDGKTDEHARHLYDIFKMSDVVAVDEKLKELFATVREDRKTHKVCLAAAENVDIKRCLQEIIDRDIYKRDYENITVPLIFENIGYETVKQNLQTIVDSTLFK